MTRTTTTTLPGAWDVAIGLSYNLSVTVQLDEEPGHCRVVKQCCEDQFSVCYSGVNNTQATITRVDSQGPAMGIFKTDGWGQDLRLTCLPAGERFPALPPPEPPSSFRVSLDFQSNALDTTPAFAQYRYAPAFGECDCAVPRLEYARRACSPGWSYNGSACYRAFPGPANWADAETACYSLAGHLASIHSPGEAAFVGRLAGAPSWVGHYCNGTSRAADPCRSPADFLWADDNGTAYLRNASFRVFTRSGRTTSSTGWHGGYIDAAGALYDGIDNGTMGYVCKLQAWVDWPLDWVRANGTCADAAYRTCQIPPLAPDGTYDIRIQVECAAPTVSSGWTAAEGSPFVGLPGCKFSRSSGRQTAFECNDGTFCDMNCIENEYELTVPLMASYCGPVINYAPDRSPNAQGCDPSYTADVRLALANGLFGGAEYPKRNCKDLCLYDRYTPQTLAYRWEPPGCWKRGDRYTDWGWICIRQVWASAMRAHAFWRQSMLCNYTEQSCCNTRGGMVRCPGISPVMCQDGTCQRNAGRCSAKGPRQCSGQLIPAKAPSIMSVAPWGVGGVTLRWVPGSYVSGVASPCTGSWFRGWYIQAQVATGPTPIYNGTWSLPSGTCLGLPRTAWQCDFADLLQGETTYFFRMRETCINPELNSDWSLTWYNVTTSYVPPMPTSTSTTTSSTSSSTTTPGETSTSTISSTTTTSTWFWDTFVGPSDYVSTQVNLSQVPARCEVMDACCGDEFSLCYDPDDRSLLTLTRTDTPGEGWEFVPEWGDHFFLRCIPPWAEPFLPHPKVPAAPPERVETAVTEAGVTARYVYSKKNASTGVGGIGDCECAFPRLEYRKSACLPGWSQHRSSCFRAFAGPGTWAEASSRCALAGGARLASVGSDAEKAFVAGVAGGDAWVGHSCTSTSTYQDTCTSVADYSWSDGSDPRYLRTTPSGAQGGLLLVGDGDFLCADGAMVALVSHRGARLVSSGSTVQLGPGRLSPDWYVTRLDSGLLLLTANDSLNLMDSNGTLGTSITTLPRNQWKVTDVGGGLVLIQSYRGQYLQDAGGTPRLTWASSAAAAQRWQVVRPDGSAACGYAPAPAASHRGYISPVCQNSLKCGGFSNVLLAAPGPTVLPAYVCELPALWDERSQSPWSLADDCSDPGRRECRLPANLSRNTYFEVRMQVACLDNATDSDFAPSGNPTITLPPCKFLTTSGSADSFECADRTLCAAADEACCIPQGGIVRCPDAAPVMCANRTCASGRDYCCAADAASCAFAGGPRPCTKKDWPARGVAIMDFASYAPASLRVTWGADAWLAGVYSRCYNDFGGWGVEIMSEDSWGVWSAQPNCSRLPRTATSCDITGLSTQKTYRLRMAETCLDPKLSSPVTETPVGVRPWPIPAGEPAALTFSSVLDYAIQVAWQPGDPNECVFRQWEVSLRLLPRPARVRASGVAEPWAPGGSWFVACTTSSRQATQCWAGLPPFPRLLSGRDYEVRVCERCQDRRADSVFRVMDSRQPFTAGDRVKILTQNASGALIPDPHPGSVEASFLEVARENTGTVLSGPRSDRRYQIQLADGRALFILMASLEEAARTTSIPATAPVGAWSYDVSQYSFGVEFQGGDPRACIFLSWDVQARANGTAWQNWSVAIGDPNSSNYSRYGCAVVGDRSRMYCTIHTPLSSGTVFDLRIRESCTDPAMSSPWATFPAFTRTLSAIRADPPYGIRIQTGWPYLLSLAWTVGPRPNDCQSEGSDFLEWLVELRPAANPSAPWVRQPECAAGPRALAECNIFGQGYGCRLSEVQAGRCAAMGFARDYDMRIREACTDPEAASVPVYFSGNTRPLMTAAAPSRVQFAPELPYLPPYTLRLLWAGEPTYDCTPTGWAVNMQAFAWTSTTSTSSTTSTGTLSTTRTTTTSTSRTTSTSTATSTSTTTSRTTTASRVPSSTTTTVTSTVIGSIASCRNPGVLPPTLVRPYPLLYCSVSGSSEGLFTNTPYKLRIWQMCNISAVTGPFRDGDFSESFVATPMGNALAPTVVEVFDVTSYTMQVRFVVPDIGDCPNPYPEVQVWPEWTWFNGSAVDWSPAQLAAPWVPPSALAPHASISGIVRVVNLAPDTLTHVQVRATCAAPYGQLTGAFTDAELMNGSAITLPGCNFPAGSGVNCTPDLWPAKAPSIDAVVSLRPTALTLRWSEMDYLSGATSRCVFKQWYVEIANASLCQKASLYAPATCTEWVPQPQCALTTLGDWRGVSCTVENLPPLTLWHARFQEQCTDPALNSAFNVTRNSTLVRGLLAGTPWNLTAAVTSNSSVNLSWQAGVTGDCEFSAWRVQVRDEVPGSSSAPWRVPSGCGNLTDRNVTTCLLTDLQADQPISIAVQETCQDPRPNSLVAQTPIFRWQRRGSWALYVGTSDSARATLNVLDRAARCNVQKLCCNDQFSPCLTSAPTVPFLATVTRSDVLRGWGQPLWLNCTSASMMPSMPQPVRASQPTGLTIKALTSTSGQVAFQLAGSIGGCECAGTELQLQAQGSGSWLPFGGPCADITGGGCVVSGLAPDTVYDARLRVGCSDPTVASNWTVVAAALATPPLCAWEVSGSGASFQCSDGSLGPTAAGCSGLPIRCPSGWRMCAAGCTSAPDCSAAGGPRTCSDENVPSRAPTIVVLASPTPTSLDLRWSQDPYVSGVASPCSFLRWSVQLANATASDWQDVCVPTQGSETITNCTVVGLMSATRYQMRVARWCRRQFFSSSAMNSVYTNVTGWTIPMPADPPYNLTVSLLNTSSLALRWTAGNNSNDCAFKEWRVQRVNAFGMWANLTECANGSNRSVGACIVGGNDRNVTQLRVAEACADGRADSLAVGTSRFRWDAPGSWEIYAGASNWTSLQVDAMAGPAFCRVSRPNVSMAAYSLCPGSSGRQIWATRTDAPGGWAQELVLNCSSTPPPGNAASGAFAPVLQLLPNVTLGRGPDARATILVSFQAGLGLGADCQCATLSVSSKRADDSAAPWVVGCTGWASRSCLLQGLDPDALHLIALNVSCAGNQSASVVSAPVATLPGCKWSMSSGRASDFLCGDGSFCSGDTCCNTRGGRQRCPATAPFMCAAAGACAGGQDFCCAASVAACAPLGGVRPCGDLDVPAKPPQVLNFTSLAPGSLTITWAPGAYLVGPGAKCNFLSWAVEISLANATPASQGASWVSQRRCGDEGLVATASCTVESLATNSAYSLRIAQVCAEAQRTSLYTLANTTATTRPLPALAPTAAACSKITANASQGWLQTTVIWSAGDLRQCTFASWLVEVQLQPQLGTLTLPASSGSPWLFGCTSSRQQTLSCSVGGLLSNFVYSFRVQAQCTDPNANSPYQVLQTCATPAVAADPPVALRVPLAGNWTGINPALVTYYGRSVQITAAGIFLAGSAVSTAVAANASSLSAYIRGQWVTAQRVRDQLAWPDGDVWARAEELYSFAAEWEPGNPWGCLFSAWELQAKPQNVTSWPQLPLANCTTTGNRSTSRCTVAVNQTGTRFDVRVREVCTDPRLTSAWREWSGPTNAFSETRAPVPAGQPAGISATRPSPLALSISWRPGDPGECVFARWRVELRPTCKEPCALSWREVAACANRSRSMPNCTANIADLALPNVSGASAFDVRVWELCIDPNAYSFPGVAQQAFQLSFSTAAPRNLSVAAAGNTWMSLAWSPSSSSTTCTAGLVWRVQWQQSTIPGVQAVTPPGDAGGAQQCNASPCNISGLRNSTAYDVQVQEICSSPATWSPAAASAMPLWTLPGVWATYVGVSPRNSIQVVVWQAPLYCYVQKACCADEFFVCPNGTRQTMTRADAPGGWGQELKLMCVSLSLAGVAARDPSLPEAPASIQLVDATNSSVLVSLPNKLSGGLGGCECASPIIQVGQATSGTVLSWRAANGTCASLAWTSRQCNASGLAQNLDYKARIAIVCRDGRRSNWTESATAMRTISPFTSVGGAVQVGGGQFVAVGRRLSDAGGGGSNEAVLVGAVRDAIAQIADVDRGSVFASAAAQGSDYVVQYEVGVAVLAPGSDTDAQSEALQVASLLADQGGAPAASSALVARLLATLGEGVSVTQVSPPSARLRVRAFPPCGPPPDVAGSAPGWSPSLCNGHTWSNPPCQVPCQPGFLSVGDGFQCSATGVWEGPPPTCVPQWLASGWSPCSSRCGVGTQARAVWCAAADASRCTGAALPTVRLCRNVSGCEWQTDDWAQCTSSCGKGWTWREVWCPTGLDDDCSATADKPADQMDCRSTFGCAWAAGAWSPCNTTCGRGLQTRALSCPSGLDSDCPLQRPASSQPCYATAGCTWQASPWSACSTACGPGTRVRAVACSSGADGDCAAAGAPPASSEACYSAAGCAWAVSDWGSCTSTCGNGVQTRSVACPSGNASDCPVPAPANFQSCRRTSGCSWQTSTWSACSSSCGTGQQVRQVSCSSGSDADCAGARPVAVQACQDVSGCGWSVGNWSTCNATCGAGLQTRSATCAAAAGVPCASPGPSTAQSCYATSGCAWVWQPWGPCSSSCGAGLETRTAFCPSGADADCPGSRATQSQACYSTAACAWQLTDWGPCSATCGAGLQSRGVSCPSGRLADCGATPPPAVQACRRTDGCTWLTGDWSGCSNSCGAGVSTRKVVCSGDSAADCAAVAAPAAEQACSSKAGCAWQVGNWDVCNTTCGYGVQRRVVQCASGNASDCPQPAPPADQRCRATAGCSWSTSSWGPCSSTCGPGTKLRDVRCSSGADADCAWAARPAAQDVCSGQACNWTVGAWGNCSVGPCAGPGTQVRQVDCPSADGAAGCALTPRPAAVAACQPRGTNCPWQVSDWSTCGNECGWGTRTRDVRCTGGNVTECASAPPTSSEPCYSLVGCTWQSTPWSACNSTCGPGVQTRDVTCATTCSGERPATTRPCYNTGSCRWTTADWGPCSASCGVGVHSRAVVCSSKVDADCPAASRPPDREECQGTSGCTWSATAWSICSSTCGTGVLQRQVQCSSGRDSDCPAATRPPGAMSCEESSGCSWSAGEWSACSAVCGQGVQNRTVRCAAPSGTTCSGSPPESTRACEVPGDCGWVAGPWSTCSSACGNGVQVRNVTCPAGKDCRGPAPATQQPCQGLSGCAWLPSGWSACSNGCGLGTRMRTVACSGGAAELCRAGAGAEPEAVGGCLDASGCQWGLSDWSDCGTSCGPQQRNVTCGQAAAACPLEAPGAPAAGRPCPAAECSAPAGAARFQLSIWLEEPLVPGSPAANALLEALRMAIAQLLGVPNATVAVRLLSAGGAAAAAAATGDAGAASASSSPAPRRRRLGAALDVEVEVAEAALGPLALLASPAGQALLAQQVRVELARGEPQAPEAAWLQRPAAPQQEQQQQQQQQQRGPFEPAAAGTVALVVLVVVVATVGGLALAAYVAWWRRSTYAKKVAPEDQREGSSSGSLAKGKDVVFQIGEMAQKTADAVGASAAAVTRGLPQPRAQSPASYQELQEDEEVAPAGGWRSSRGGTPEPAPSAGRSQQASPPRAAPVFPGPRPTACAAPNPGSPSPSPAAAAAAAPGPRPPGDDGDRDPGRPAASGPASPPLAAPAPAASAAARTGQAGRAVAPTAPPAPSPPRPAQLRQLRQPGPQRAAGVEAEGADAAAAASSASPSARALPEGAGAARPAEAARLLPAQVRRLPAPPPVPPRAPGWRGSARASAADPGPDASLSPRAGSGGGGGHPGRSHVAAMPPADP